MLELKKNAGSMQLNSFSGHLSPQISQLLWIFNDLSMFDYRTAISRVKGKTDSSLTLKI